jgi:hypothetical protein
LNAWSSKVGEVWNFIAINWILPSDWNLSHGRIVLAVLQNALDEIEKCVLDVTVEQRSDLLICEIYT